MPRINIEEKWWSDPRRSMLIIKLGLEADAAMLNAIKLSQDFNGEFFDPKNVMPDHWVDALLSVGLAMANQTLEGRLIYIKGSKEHHEWIRSQRERGKLGGNKSAKLRQAIAKPLLSNGQANAQPSSSSSFSKKTLSSKELSGRSDADLPNKTGLLISSLKKYFEQNLKRKLPPLTGKQIGVCKRLAASWTEKEIAFYAERFTQWRDPWVTKRGHPVELLESNFEQLHAWATSHESHLTNLAESKFSEETIKKKLEKDLSNAQFNQFLTEPNQRNSNGIRNEIQNQSFGRLQEPTGKRDDRKEFIEPTSEDDFS